MADCTFQGTFTALVTPFGRDGDEVDWGALERLVEEQIAGGVAGLVACGTTAESPTLSADEQREVVAQVVRTAAGRVPVVAGTGTNSTHKSIAASRAAIKAGADAVMLVVPYYNKPSQDGLRQHMVTVAQAVDRPVVVYNIPGRSGVDLNADTTEQICQQAPNVHALKDATGNVTRCQELKRRLGERLAVLSGDDALTLGMMAVGAAGVISVTANVLPGRVSEVTSLMAKGDLEAARGAHFRLLELHRAMFLEPNPVPCKAALALLGRMSPEVRLPLVGSSRATRSAVASALRGLGLDLTDLDAGSGGS